MEYNFSEIEKKWQQYWKVNKTYKTVEDAAKPKFYVLDMFPYPSGAGLHVGHPLGYIASDIYSRYKRLRGFNVLHPMGYDAFGLPAEQYAIQTGQHPRVTTDANIARYRRQLDKIGFSFDWDREVKTCESEYYKWTQKTFIDLYNHYYNTAEQKAKPVTELVAAFEKNGNAGINAACGNPEVKFTAAEWKAMDEKAQHQTLMEHRLAYQKDGMVNWCPQLGTVLANDEVANGLSIRGGYPVERKLMRQWYLRITAYADRMLEGLDRIDWSESLKETQRNWIGRSTGANVRFKLQDSLGDLEIFTTRADTMFGATFMVIAPEHPVLSQVQLDKEVEDYVSWAKNRSERERQSEVKNVTGKFTGLYAKNPFTEKQIPVWVSEYVLAGYGTGAIMAVPAHDSRDYAFAKHFGLEIIPLIKGCDVSNESFDAKEGEMVNSGFLNGMQVKDAIKAAIGKVEELGIGTAKVNFRLRDAAFSRQRYWGEPFPVYYKDDMPHMLPPDKLPLELPSVDKYLPTEAGDPPLGRATDWKYEGKYGYELSTMPGFAGSSAYFLRYMDPHSDKCLVDKKKNEYWRNVDLYIGGTEHATGHLMYARFWNMFLFDIGEICESEPFQKLINQGMIQGRSNFVYRVVGTDKFVSLGLKSQYETQEIHVDVNIVSNDILDLDKFKASRPEYANAEFILKDGKYVCGWAVEKMSKSYYNVVNPDDVVSRYGADTLRLYEMFLGPLEMSKPWDTNGIDGVHRFLRKLWRLCHDAQNNFSVSNDKATPQELKSLHKIIKKVQEDIEAFSFNTAVSGFMICVNELTELKCNKREVLEPLAILIAPFVPHIAEELWESLGQKASICNAKFPEFNPAMLVESSFEYPVSFNGKLRYKKEMPLGLSKEEVRQRVMQDENTAKFLEGKPLKNFVYVPGKIVNIVC
ncbi:MAG: leucine--tRNA ligase [Prevotellaceae bacterium]|jgi:leucyl-tRNA synthetase|nr:leucine--tRNA ligase [Prevotellaceae bacterium]